MSDTQIELPTIDVNNDDYSLKVQSFFQKFGRQIIVGIVAVIVVIGGFYAYKEFVVKPKEQKAAELIYKAQQYFSQDSSKKVLDGDESAKGVLYIISEFGGTKSANLAKYYAGVSYLKLGQFDKAIEYLKDFKTDAKQVQMVSYGALADALAESGKKEDAVDYYQKAATTFEKDESISAEYLFRAGLLSETIGKADKALSFYKEVKEKYPKTEKGTQIDKYISRLSVEKPDL